MKKSVQIDKANERVDLSTADAYQLIITQLRGKAPTNLYRQSNIRSLFPNTRKRECFQLGLYSGSRLTWVGWGVWNQIPPLDQFRFLHILSE